MKETTVLSKYLDEDYKPINACKRFLLPKEFGERKHFTAYIRKNTREGVRLTEDTCLPIWRATIIAKELGFDRSFRKERALASLSTNQLVKFSKLWQEALIESEYNGELSPNKVVANS